MEVPVQLVHDVFKQITPQSQLSSSIFSKRLDKESFLEYLDKTSHSMSRLPLPGALGNRLFMVIDKDRSGDIDFQEFSYALTKLHSGTTEYRADMIFDMHDLDANGVISQKEFAIMLTNLLDSLTPQVVEEFNRDFALIEETPTASKKNTLTLPSMRTAMSSYSLRTSRSISCDVRQTWVDSTVMEIFTVPRRSARSEYASSGDRLPFLSRQEFVRSVLPHAAVSRLVDLFFSEGLPLKALLPIAPSGEADTGWVHSGWLVDRRRFKRKTAYFFGFYENNFLYYYERPMAPTPVGVICLTSATEVRGHIMHDGHSGFPSSEGKPDFRGPLYSFEIWFGKKARVLYAGSKAERDQWVEILSRRDVFHHAYAFLEKWACGRYGTVFRACDKARDNVVAVKVIERKVEEVSRRQRRQLAYQREREMRRSEIATLQVLQHPNVVQLIDVVGNCKYQYIVLEWISMSMSSIIHTLQSARIAIDAVQPSDVLFMPPIAAVQTPMDAPRVKTCQLESRPEYCVRMAFIDKGSNMKLLEMEQIPNPIEILIKVFTGQILEGLAHMHASCRNIVHRDMKPDNILFDVHQDVVEPLKNLYEACALLCGRVCQGGFNADTVQWMFRFTRSLGLIVCVLTRAALMSSRCHLLGSSHLTPKVGNLLTSTELLGARSEGSSNSSRVVLSLPCTKTVVDGVTWNASEIPEMKETELSKRTCKPFMIAEDSELWESLETVTPAELTRMIRTVTNELTFFLDQNLTVKIADFGFAVVLAPDEDELVSSREDLNDTPSTGKKWYRPRGCGQERGRRVASMPRVATEDVGTQAYAAPEVLNQQPYSTLADMYSVGVLVCEGLCEGRIPRRGQEDRLHTVLPEDLRHITSVGRDFIRRVVTNHSRLSAEEALDHPWITGESLESFLRE